MSRLRFKVTGYIESLECLTKALDGTGKCGHDAKEFEGVSSQVIDNGVMYRVKCDICGHKEKVFCES